MDADEAGTLAALKRHRESLFNPAVAEHGGRVIKLVGDGTLVEFSSVVDAVSCALAIQSAEKAAADVNGAGIVLRIGINLGDVIIEGDDIYGDGVNIAARLESLADPGGICIASIVNESIGNRVDAAFSDGGEVSVKNIDRPIRVWKWHPDDDSGAARAGAVEPAIPRPDLPSIAVLPFDNMSGDPEQEYFSDGISEDLITDLSKVAGLIVIARNSSFAYKGKSIDLRTVARDLGVRTVLEGSIRRAGNRVRITAQLIDASTGAHLWAERYDRDMTDIFELQDDVTRRIVDALKVTLTPAEAARLSEGGTKSVEAHDLFMRARALLVGSAKDASVFREIVALLKGAIALDPDYGEAYGGLAMAHNLDFQNRWSDDPDRSLQISMDFANLAVEKAPNDAFCHYVASMMAGFLRDAERAEAEIEIALRLGPNLALAINAKGAADIFGGRAEAAIPNIERAMRLDPGFSQQYLHFLGLAHLLTGRNETAAAEFRQRIQLVPETDISRVYLAAALGNLGEVDEAKRVWAEMKAINPKYSFDAHIGRLPFRRQADIDTIRDGLAKASLPD
jgi:adenylate cyclase